MSDIHTVEARQVRVGDELCDGWSNHLFHWTRVRDIREREDGRLAIDTTMWSTVKHPREAVTVRRRRPPHALLATDESLMAVMRAGSRACQYGEQDELAGRFRVGDLSGPALVAHVATTDFRIPVFWAEL